MKYESKYEPQHSSKHEYEGKFLLIRLELNFQKLMTNLIQGMHPNANPNQPGGLSQLQQRLTQQRMSRMQGPGGMPMVQNSMYTINTTGVGPNIQVSSPAMIMTTGASPISGGHFVSSPQQPPHMAGVPSPSQRMSAPSPSQTSIRTPQVIT